MKRKYNVTLLRSEVKTIYYRSSFHFDIIFKPLGGGAGFGGGGVGGFGGVAGLTG